MKRLFLLSLVSLLAFGLANAGKIKFAVDMTGQTVSPNGVHIAGDFQSEIGVSSDWQPDQTQLMQEGATNIYSIIVNLPADAAYQFKFLNGNTWGDVETVPNESRVAASGSNANDNRWIWLDSNSNGDTLFIGAVGFGGNAPAGKYLTRFAVDMATSTVDAEGVHIAGSIQGWDPSKTQMYPIGGGTKYEYIAYLDAGSYEYKFVNGNAWGKDESVPSGCATNNNRAVTVTNADQEIGVVCYGSCAACPTAPIPKYTLTLRVDMTAIVACETIDSVTAAGGLLPGGWGDGTTLLDGDNDKIYEATVTVDSGEVQFKFRYHKSGNTNWEGGITTGSGNREVALTANTTTPANCFSSMVACKPVPGKQDITFLADLRNEVPGDTIWLMGDFTTPSWQGGALKMTPMAGTPGVYTVTVNQVCPATIFFKFTNGDRNSVANEETFPDANDRACVAPNGVGGFNRVLERTSANAETLKLVYNTCKTSNVSVNEVKQLDGVRVYPNPMTEATLVEFENQGVYNVSVTDISGRVIKSYSNITGSYVVIEKAGLKSGLYLVNITSADNKAAVVKLSVQ